MVDQEITREAKGSKDVMDVFRDSIRIVPDGDIAWVELDMVGEKINKWSTPMMRRLQEVVAELRRSSYRAVIFISRKPKIFVVGADINEIKSLRTREQFDEAVRGGQGVFNEVEDLPMVTIAAIHGATAGGGCEFVLACDWRIATDDSSTRIGLPETKLGIIPGFGGCVRLPRLIGLPSALDIILQGKLVRPDKAHKMGLVDLVVHVNQLEQYAKEWALQKGKRKTFYQPKTLTDTFLHSPLGRPVVFKKAKEQVLRATHGHYPAPLKAIEVIQRTYGWTQRDWALKIEREAFTEVAVTDVSRHLIHVFDLTEMVKKQTGVADAKVQPLPVEHIGVLGAGIMGGGIAFVAADNGIEVRLKDLSYAAIGKGLSHARGLWEKLVKRKAITSYEFQEKLSRISGGTDWSDFRRSDLVIEAIVEDMEIKKKALMELSQHVREGTIVVTNTSSLSVTEMAEGYPRPDRFAGMHFFNPVDKMPLVEVIRGEKTSDETVVTVFELSKKLGKMPVVVKDGPGFLVNRLLLPYMMEAAFLLQEGQDIARTDQAFVKRFGMPMGPYALMDEVGLDVCVKVLKIFKKVFGERVQIAPFLENLEKNKDRLGKKVRKGFYLYDEQGKRGEVDPQIYSVLGLGQPKHSLPDEEAIHRAVFSMINECARALVTDQIVASAAEVDLAMIMGTGFPPFRGGLCVYADEVGLNRIISKLEKWSKSHLRLKVSRELETISEKGGFYKAFPPLKG